MEENERLESAEPAIPQDNAQPDAGTQTKDADTQTKDADTQIKDTDSQILEAAEQAVHDFDYDEALKPPVPEKPIEGTAYKDPFFNIPPVLGAMDGLDREAFWSEVTSTKHKKRRPSAAVIILASLMLIVMTGILVTVINGRGWLVKLINGGKSIEFTLPTVDKPRLDSTKYQEDGRYTIEGLAEAVSPSVVSLEIYNSKAALLPSSQGSGIIMTTDGYIVTNAHVVEDAEKIKAVLHNREEYSADVVGSDPASDIAVVKIGKKDLQPAEYGDSDKVSLGEDVVCIGSPAGFYGTVTKGIVSGMDRLIKVESYSTPMKCIQVDAAINPGNSGGALFNMWGQVIGITSSKLSSTKYDGIGFAISINAARPIIEELVSVGYLADKPKIGITYYFITEETARSANALPGLLIAEIDEKCDIANTELQKGDIIASMNGTDLKDADTVKKILEGSKPGDTINAHIFRPNEDSTGGEEFDITFKLEKDTTSFVEREEEKS